jgi:hypothetical protein
MGSAKRASVPLQYRVMLIGPDGAEWEWRITDNYWDRRMKKISAEMLEVVREHDLSYEFGLEEKPPEERFRTCRFCNATSPPGKNYHKVGCTRPRAGESVTAEVINDG